MNATIVDTKIESHPDAGENTTLMRVVAHGQDGSIWEISRLELEGHYYDRGDLVEVSLSAPLPKPSAPAPKPAKKGAAKKGKP